MLQFYFIIELESHANIYRGWWGKKKQNQKNHTSFLPLSWSSFSLQSPLQKEVKHHPLLFPHLFSVCPQSLSSVSSSLAWVVLHFYAPKHLVLPWKECQVVIKSGSLPNGQQLKMPRCQGLQQRKGLFKRQPSGKMGEQVSDVGKGLEIWDTEAGWGTSLVV